VSQTPAPVEEDARGSVDQAVRQTPPPVEEDARGIVDPEILRRRVVLTRYPAGEPLEGLVDRFWTVRWTLPAGASHHQQVLTHPGANLSVASDAPPQLYGVQRRLSTRTVSGHGWAVAAMTAPGGLGALITVPAYTVMARVVPLRRPVVDVDDAAIAATILRAESDEQRVAALRTALGCVAERADPARLVAAREVVAVARIAETDRSVRRVEDLAARAGVTVRTLQRLFSAHAGVSPTWVVRRYRLLEAAELARGGDAPLRAAGGWSALAVELGYSDQAHLVRDFKAHFGVTPAAYAGRQPVP
jgi:AraC-like DNA-binding protein